MIFKILESRENWYPGDNEPEKKDYPTFDATLNYPDDSGYALNDTLDIDVTFEIKDGRLYSIPYFISEIEGYEGELEDTTLEDISKIIPTYMDTIEAFLKVNDVRY